MVVVAFARLNVVTSIRENGILAKVKTTKIVLEKCEDLCKMSMRLEFVSVGEP